MEKQQELMFKLSLFEQQIKNIQEQIPAIEQAVIETDSLRKGLEELKEAKNKETLSSIGKGIFIKTKIQDENLIVDVGGRNFVKKTIPETQNLIKKQITKLEEVKQELENRLEEINKELTQVFLEAQEEN